MKAKSPNPEKFNEPEFISRLRKGDHTAYREMDDEFFAKLIVFAEREFGISHEDAKDLAQEVMISIFRNIKQYNPARGKFVQWAFRILRNRCIDWLRAHKNIQLVSWTSLTTEPTVHEETQPSQENLSALEKLPPEVRQAILKLPGRYQQFIGLILLGASKKYIMEIMQIKTQVTFRSLKSRVFSRLRAEIHQPQQEK